MPSVCQKRGNACRSELQRMSRINVLGKRDRSYISACFALRERLSRFYIDVIKLRSGAVHSLFSQDGICTVVSQRLKKNCTFNAHFLLFILPRSLLSYILVAFSLTPVILWGELRWTVFGPSWTHSTSVLLKESRTAFSTLTNESVYPPPRV